MEAEGWAEARGSGEWVPGGDEPEVLGGAEGELRNV